MHIKGKILDSELEITNKRLSEQFGVTEYRNEKLPNFRIIWSDDLLEKRLCTHTNEGFQLLYPEIREVPKYKQWLQEKYVLEKLTEVPVFQLHELTTELSYEPLWVFEDSKGNALYPRLDAALYIINNTIEAGRKGKFYTKTIEDDSTPEAKAERVKKLMAELFGNETETTDAMAYREAIVVPHPYIKEN